jgi:hypothetical protein
MALSTILAVAGLAQKNVKLPFCQPKDCLYYAGDFDAQNSSANAVYNADSAGTGKGQVWVGVRPAHDAVVTGGTFNECASTPTDGIGVNPTPFAVKVGIKPGHAGKTVCSTSGNATFHFYLENNICNQASYTIAKLSKACRLSRGKVYYVNLLPRYDGTDYYAFLADVEDKPAPNHYGWKNVIDNSYFNGDVGRKYVYVPTWGTGGGCGGIGCDAFSIALTGTQKR